MVRDECSQIVHVDGSSDDEYSWVHHEESTDDGEGSEATRRKYKNWTAKPEFRTKCSLSAARDRNIVGARSDSDGQRAHLKIRGEAGRAPWRRLWGRRLPGAAKGWVRKRDRT
ncbi:hypothetical protein PPTG_24850 [Phytophthora nicotianae INRA-310]|uniref:Uncharacterized protein n=1 Tax=Phytophthora nicotianae (strain INRA-310) TaxID=761204 RepID=W2PA60_PHYN3|nr:hypothetical protein PPTG_24850 [Phytophthora nicotianae INRA-310]ETM97711.1 hypothetical protein PPTG_24850 [Phytophthora nicotianae INRA-310]